jgi:cytochrome oxidase Cu insertion factor (SCO1/SenC/PrrC family)
VPIVARALAMLLAWMTVAAAFAQAAGDPRAIPLIDQSGRVFRLNDLAGKPAIVTFVASRCTDACPIANAAFARMYRRLRSDHVSARLVTITLDPDFDTPAVMARVASRFGVPRDGWRFASGRAADVRALMQSLGVEAEPDEHGVPEAHTSFVYVLDRNARLKRTLLLSTALTQDVENVLGERSS